MSLAMITMYVPLMDATHAADAGIHLLIVMTKIFVPLIRAIP
jgi:hypothetical protein